ncbi:NUDIX domain-containing protein [Nesterenkonia aurantiaca]|uniref:NUDIX domain-containing protein n=1 Tax=Nesterenkonia aurantiaca TaxID=1436010 RepID=UPI003EE81B49
MYQKRVIEAATADIDRAHTAEHGVHSWFQTEWAAEPQPLASDVWVFTPDFQRLLVVEHRWRGLVPPGGKVEVEETPREGAVRELAEEAGVHADLAVRPAFAAVRAYRRDWPPTLNLSYWAIADPAVELGSEPGQPACWVDVNSGWRTFHEGDALVIAEFAQQQRDPS